MPQNNYAAGPCPSGFIYNRHGAHTALAGRPPASPVTNLSGQYTELRRGRVPREHRL